MQGPIGTQLPIARFPHRLFSTPKTQLLGRDTSHKEPGGHQAGRGGPFLGKLNQEVMRRGKGWWLDSPGPQPPQRLVIWTPQLTDPMPKESGGGGALRHGVPHGDHSWVESSECTHIHTCTLTSAHAHILMNLPSNAHTCSFKCIHLHPFASTCTTTQTNILTLIDSLTHTHSQKSAHICTLKITHVHTQTLTDTQTHTHAHTFTLTHLHINTFTNMHTYTGMLRLIHSRIQTHKLTHRNHTHSHIHLKSLRHTDTLIHTFIHIHSHAPNHTYIHRHRWTYRLNYSTNSHIRSDTFTYILRH